MRLARGSASTHRGPGRFLLLASPAMAGQPACGGNRPGSRLTANATSPACSRSSAATAVIIRIWDYEGISPRLQQIRGPYTLEAALEAYAEHVGLVPGLSEATPGRPGAGEAMMIPGPADPDIATRPRLATRPSAVPAPRHPHDAGDSWLRTDAGSVVTLPPPGQPGHGRTARLRRQPFRLVDGRVEGGSTDAFEVICPSCGDNPDLDYSEIPPWLQCLRGPRTIKEGLAVYLEHIGG